MSNKKNSPKSPPNEVIFYEADDGKISIAVRFEHENIWLTQKHMAELFECTTDNISLHLRNIYLSGELTKESTTEEFSVVQQEGRRSVARKTLFYQNAPKNLFLQGVGKVSHEVAKALVQKEFEKYRVVQDSLYKSDFDKLVEASSIKKS